MYYQNPAAQTGVEVCGLWIVCKRYKDLEGGGGVAVRGEWSYSVP